MSNGFSVCDLYPIALAEGEGMGTAYEYSAKLKLLLRLLGPAGPPRRVLIGGLPEAYGVGLDLVLLGSLYGCHTVVQEDREPALAAFSAVLRAPQVRARVDPARVELRGLAALTEAGATAHGEPPYDLWVTTSAIQRLDEADLGVYLARVREQARCALLLAPNGDNRAHLTLTKLRGLALPALVSACLQAGLAVHEAGYVDLPPFPPGISRSAEAKERAAESSVERLAMSVLEGWARGERLLPLVLKRRYAHLVYAFVA